MRRCGDACYRRCQTVRRAGLRKCAEMGRRNGRPDPQRDIELIRKAELCGYKTTAELMGGSPSAVAKTVRVYAEYAESILKEERQWS